MPQTPTFGMLCMPDRVLRTQLSCSLQCICSPPFVNPGSAPGNRPNSSIACYWICISMLQEVNLPALAHVMNEMLTFATEVRHILHT